MMCCMTGKSFRIYGDISAPYASPTPAIHTACSVGLALYSTLRVIVFSHAHAATLVRSQQFADCIRNGLLVRRASGYRRSCEPAKNDNCTGRCHGSVFQQHNPSRNQPRTTKRAQMPNVESWNDAHCPEDDRQRRGRPHERQQPEQIPWIYDWRTQKRCCHGPCKCFR